MEFTVNRDQSIVPVESLLSGIRALEGGIIVSGSGINDTVNYSSILSEDSDGLMLTNLSFLYLSFVFSYINDYQYSHHFDQ